jgi:putative tricarboxylic transport membrane protein
MLNTDLIVGFSGLAIAVLAFVFTRDIGLLGKIFVDYVLIVIAFLGIMIVVKGFVKPERLRFFESIVERNNILAGLLILALYLLFMPRIGFLPSSYIFFLVLSLYLTDDRLALKRIVQAAILSGIIVTGFYFVFKNLLVVPLPDGSWFAE